MAMWKMHCLPVRTLAPGGVETVPVISPRQRYAQQLHPEQEQFLWRTERLHYGQQGQPSTVEYAYPVGVAQFYLWSRNLTQRAPWLQFWPGNTGYGAPTRPLRNNQARATIYGTGPTTTNTSLRALVAAAYAAQGRG